MTHDELLAKLSNDENGYAGSTPLQRIKALRAVVELHTPIETYNINNVHKSWLTCTHCHDETYPCPTIQAIEGKLE